MLPIRRKVSLIQTPSTRHHQFSPLFQLNRKNEDMRKRSVTSEARNKKKEKKTGRKEID